MLISLVKGLVTNVSPVAAPPDSCVVLDNFVVNETGRLIRRPGTEVVLANGNSNYYVKQLATCVVIISEVNGDIVFYDTEFTELFRFTGVYQPGTRLNFSDVDDPDFYGVVIFAENANPVQVNIAEFSYSHTAGTRTVTVANWSHTNVVALKDYKYTPATIAAGINVTYGTTAELTLLHLTYSLWLPGQYFFGNELFNVVAKTATSKVVLIPESLVTDLTVKDKSLISVYRDNSTKYTVTTRPRLSSEVAFSDGQEYEYSSSNSVKFSPFFLTFGQKVYSVKFDLSTADVDTVNNSLVIQNHAFEDGAIVNFVNEAPGGVLTGTDYVVRNSSSDRFKLETLAGSPVTFTNTYNTTRPSFEFNTYQITADGTVFLSGASVTKSKYRVFSSNILPTALENNGTYFVEAVAGEITFYDEQRPNSNITLSRLKTNTFNVADVDFINNEINIPGHGYFNGQPVAIINASSLVSPLLTNTVYYAFVVTADKVKLFYDIDLQNLVDLTVVSTTSINLGFTNVNFETNVITAANHSFSSGDTVIIDDLRPTVLPVAYNTIYYVKRLTSSTFELYYDINLISKIDFYLAASTLRTFSDTDISSNRATVEGHGIPSGTPVMFEVSAPTGAIIKTVYYAKSISSNVLEFYENNTLSTLVPISASTGNSYTFYIVQDYTVALKKNNAGAGTVFITDAWGGITLTPEYETGFIESVNYESVLLSRRRQIKFDSTNLEVLVDGTPWTRVDTASTTNKYFVTNVDGVVQSMSTPVNSTMYVSFEANTDIGVSASSFVEFVDTTIGSAMGTGTAISGYHNRYVNKSGLVKYGWHDFFSLRDQPTVAVVAGNRLFLAKNLLVLSSNTLDSFVNERYFNNFTIDDRLEGTNEEPYYFVLSKSGVVVDMLEFQDTMFIFTTRAIFRLSPTNALNYVIRNVANQGVSSRNCVTKLQSFIVYANEYGVYLLNSEVQDLYYALELSINIGSEYKKHKCLSLVFDPSRDCLYSFGATETFCYNVIAKAWSLFRYPFTVSKAFYTEKVYVATPTKLLKFSDVPLDDAVYNVNAELVNGAIFVNDVLTKASFALPAVSTVYFVDSSKTYDYINRTWYPSGEVVLSCAVSDGYYGFEIHALVISGATVQQNLSEHSVNVFANVAYSKKATGNNEEFSYGILFGSDPTPELVNNAVSKNDVHDYSSFSVLKEPIQGVANSYQFILFTKCQANLQIDGYDIFVQPSSLNYYSGGN